MASANGDVRIGVDMAGLRQGAGEHGAAASAASDLAATLRLIVLDPAALGSVASVAGFAGGVAAAAKAQADGAAAESDHRSTAQAGSSAAADLADTMVASTTRAAQGATPPR